MATDSRDGYSYDIVHSPSFAALMVHMRKGQTVQAEKGALMYMDRGVEIETKRREGGLLKGLLTSALGGESFFVNNYNATADGDLVLVGPLVGDIQPFDVQGKGYILQSGAFLASSPKVALDTKWAGLKGFLSEKDFVMLRASGDGTIWVSAFGGILDIELDRGQQICVDTGHLVGFPEDMPFAVRRVGGWKSTILSGEGLVTDLTGPGRVLLQTRNLPTFAAQLIPYLPKPAPR